MNKRIKVFCLVGLCVLTGLYSCVQPYSRLILYKNEKVNAADIQPMAVLPEADYSLKYDNILFLLQARNMSVMDIWHALKSVDRHWKLKGSDIKTAQYFYTNYYLPANKEALVWHAKVNAFEYVTANVNHCLSLISQLKRQGFKLESTSAENGLQYSNGTIRITIARVILHDGTNGYKLLFKTGSADHST